MTADQILQKHEDANEMHFHQVDREWIIQAMEEYATSSQTEISDREMEEVVLSRCSNIQQQIGWYKAIEWYREQLKQRQ